jgi:hypothetical protein
MLLEDELEAALGGDCCSRDPAAKGIATATAGVDWI